MKKPLIFLAVILFLSAVLVLSGCASIMPNYGSVFGSDGNASISVPSGWNTNDPTITKMFPAAVIGASDNVNQEYVAVIGEPKSYLGSNSTVKDFFAQIKAGSVAIVANGVWGTPSAITIDGLNGLIVQFSGINRKNKTNSTFFVNVLANDNYYYAVLAFTDTALVSTNEVTLQKIINSFKAPANTVVKGSWKPYTFPGSVILAFILLIVGTGLIFLGRRLKHSTEVPHPGKRLKIAMITIWALLILFIMGVTVFNRIGRTAIGNGQTGIGPIFPITLACAVGVFIYVAYISRHDGILTALGRAFVCGAAGPMVFEFPFDMIVIPQIKAPAAYLIAYFGVLDVTVLMTLSLLLLSKRVSMTRYSLYALGAMFIVWVVWAWFGFSYPSNPISFTLNAISKVLGFISVAALFSTEPKQIPVGEINKPIEGQ
jgi:uncharacterized protein YceK